MSSSSGGSPAAHLTWRPLADTDVDALVALQGRVEAVDERGEFFSADDVGDYLADSRLALPEASLSTWDGSRLVAYGLVRFESPRSGGVWADVDGAVDPAYRGRGLGSQVVDQLVAAARAVVARRWPEHQVCLCAHVSEPNPAHTAILRAAGFEPSVQLIDVERRIDDVLPPADPPDGTAVLAWDALPRDVTSRAYADAVNGIESLEQVTAARTFRPELSFGLIDRDSLDVLGMALARYYSADTDATGVPEVWMHRVVVRRAARGRGVVDGLLRHAFTAYREAGFARVSLTVRSDEPAAALPAYTALGFEIGHRWTSYSRS